MTGPPADREAILVAGESLIDVVERAGRAPVELPGGSPANVAVGLARLGNAVELATWFADDPRGRRVREWLEADGVVVAAGSQAAAHTSTARARIGSDGAAEYIFDLVDDLPAVSPTRPPGHVHVGSIAAVREPSAAKVTALVERYAPQATVSYDPNVRPAVMPGAGETRRLVEELVARADVVKVSDEDLAWLAPGEDVPAVLRSWVGLGPALVVLTQGGAGAVAVTAAGRTVEVNAPRVAVADTVGAGDSFMAGVVDGLGRAGLLGARRRERLQAVDAGTVRELLLRAATIAAITVSREGADPPTAAEVESFPPLTRPPPHPHPPNRRKYSS